MRPVVCAPDQRREVETAREEVRLGDVQGTGPTLCGVHRRHGLLVEQVEHVQAQLEAPAARHPELVLHQQVGLRVHVRPAVAAASKVLHWIVVSGDDGDVARDRHTTRHVLVQAQARPDRELVDELGLELVRPIGVQRAENRLRRAGRTSSSGDPRRGRRSGWCAPPRPTATARSNCHTAGSRGSCCEGTSYRRSRFSNANSTLS